LRAVLVELLAPLERTLDLSGKKPCIIMLVGVNGAGKTTSIGSSQGTSKMKAARSCSPPATPFAPQPASSSLLGARKNSVAVVAQSGGDPERWSSTRSRGARRAGSTW